jgi:replicative superfamily II helicase
MYDHRSAGGTMKQLIALIAVLLWALPLMAETYSWVDESGTVNFTEDYSRVPQKYRKKVNRRGDIGGQPAPASRDTDTAAGKTGQPLKPQTTNGNTVAADAGKGLYDGKKTELWQQEFQARDVELKRLERQLVDLEALIKKPAGISKERAFGLPQEFKETQKRYNDALKRYNELNDVANKAGLPAEFRK